MSSPTPATAPTHPSREDTSWIGTSHPRPTLEHLAASSASSSRPRSWASSPTTNNSFAHQQQQQQQLTTKYNSWGRSSQPPPPPSQSPTPSLARSSSTLTPTKQTPTARLRALSHSAPRPSSVIAHGGAFPLVPRRSDSPALWAARRDSIAVGIVTPLTSPESVELLEQPPFFNAVEELDVDSPVDRFSAGRQEQDRWSRPPKPTSPLPPLPPGATDEPSPSTPTAPKPSPPLPAVPLDDDDDEHELAYLSSASSPPLPALPAPTPPDLAQLGDPEPPLLPPPPLPSTGSSSERQLSSAAMAALADTPPRVRPPLPSKSASRSRSASVASLSSSTPQLGLSHPRPRNPPTRAPSLSHSNTNTTMSVASSSRASSGSALFTPGSSALRSSAYSREGSGEGEWEGEEKEELGGDEIAVEEEEEEGEGVVEGQVGGRRLLRHGSGSPRRQPIDLSSSSLRIDDPSPALAFGLGIQGWRSGEANAEADDLQRDVEEFERFARSLPSPVPPLSARSGVGGAEGGWSSLPPELRGLTSGVSTPSSWPSLSPQPNLSPVPVFPEEERPRPRTPSIPRPSFPPPPLADSAIPNDLHLHHTNSTTSLLVPPSQRTSLSPHPETDGERTGGGGGYLSESGVDDFFSDGDEEDVVVPGVVGGGESYARHYLPFGAAAAAAGGLGISAPGVGGGGLWDGEEEVLDPEEAAMRAMGGKRGVVDWREKGIESMGVPTDTTHLILAKSTTPRQVPLLLRRVVPTLSLGLVVLDISHGSLLEIPLAVASCSSLQELNISHNTLATRTLPPFLATLPALRVLLADQCGLVDLPASLSQLSRLHTLSVRGNKLRALPSWLCRLEGLECLRVEGNPWQFQWSKVVAPLMGGGKPVAVQNDAGGTAEASARSSLASSVTSTSTGGPLTRSMELPPGLASPPAPLLPLLPLPASAPPTTTSPSVAAEPLSPPLKPTKSNTSLRNAFLNASHSFLASSTTESLPASPTPGQHSFSTPPPSSAPVVDGRTRHQSEGVGMGTPTTTPTDNSTVSGSGEKATGKKWSSKIFKKAGARLRSGSSSRPGSGALSGNEGGRGYSEPLPGATIASLAAAEGTALSLGGRKRVLSRPGKLPPSLALREEERGLGKRRSFLLLNNDEALLGSVGGAEVALANPVDHQAALRSVMAYLRDLDDLSNSLTLPPITLDSPTPSSTASSSSPSLRHSPSLGSISPSPSPTPTFGIRRAQSSRRLPVRPSTGDRERTHSGRFSQLFNDDGVPVSTPSSSSETPCGPTTSSSAKLKDDPLKRDKVVREIVETEQSYLKGLRELCDIYIAAGSVPVNSSSGRKDTVLPAAERRAVFGNVEAIRDFHEKIFLPDLLEAVKTNPSTLPAADTTLVACDVARVFVRHAAFLKIYSSYVNGFDAALARIQSWAMDSSRPTTSSGASPQLGSSTGPGAPFAFDPSAAIVTTLSTNKRKRIRSYLKRCKAHPSHSQISLESYLLLPVQRVPRYRMLLESLVACTPALPTSTSFGLLVPVAPEAALASLDPHPVLQEALELIGDVATAMNERKRETEGRAQLLYWQGRIGNRFRSPLVQPHRTLLRSGTWTLVRTVKRSSTYIESLGSSTGPGAGRPSTSNGGEATETVHTLQNEAANQRLIALLCTDLLVLAKEPSNASDQQSTVDLYTVLRLNSAGMAKPPPVSLFGSELNMLRITCDSRAILYVQCASKSEASGWMGAINTQWAVNT